MEFPRQSENFQNEFVRRLPQLSTVKKNLVWVTFLLTQDKMSYHLLLHVVPYRLDLIMADISEEEEK
jgi:hypothetical protein